MAGCPQAEKDFSTKQALVSHIQGHLASAVGEGIAERLGLVKCRGGCQSYCTVVVRESHRTNGCGEGHLNSNIRKRDNEPRDPVDEDERELRPVNGGLGPRQNIAQVETPR